MQNTPLSPSLSNPTITRVQDLDWAAREALAPFANLSDAEAREARETLAPFANLSDAEVIATMDPSPWVPDPYYGDQNKYTLMSECLRQGLLKQIEELVMGLGVGGKKDERAEALVREFVATEGRVLYEMSYDTLVELAERIEELGEETEAEASIQDNGDHDMGVSEGLAAAQGPGQVQGQVAGQAQNPPSLPSSSNPNPRPNPPPSPRFRPHRSASEELQIADAVLHYQQLQFPPRPQELIPSRETRREQRHLMARYRQQLTAHMALEEGRARIRKAMAEDKVGDVRRLVERFFKRERCRNVQEMNAGQVRETEGALRLVFEGQAA